MTRRLQAFHLLLIVGTGALGWAAVASATWAFPERFRPWHVSAELLSCLALGVIARLLAVPVLLRVRVALDSLFYIAATFVFGVVPASWLVLVALTADRCLRFVRRAGAKSSQPPHRRVAELLYAGGLPAMMILLFGAAFRIDSGYPHATAHLAWTLPVFATCFVSGHYFLASGSYWLEGVPTRELWRNFGRVAGYELALIPLAVAMVLGAKHYGIWSVGLLSVSFIVFNWLFRRTMRAQQNLQHRVEELSTLNEVGRIIGATLERRSLAKNVAIATLRLVGHASLFTIGLREASGRVQYDLYDDRGEKVFERSAPQSDGISGWIMQRREALLIADMQRQFHLYCQDERYNDAKYHSFLGVPLVLHDEVLGVISVQSEERGSYNLDHLRVLAGIADLAVVALENARLYELATVDGLTGLMVRRHFDQRLHEEWERSVRYGSAFALGMLDLDDFKHLNDTFGHPAGDQVLRKAASVVSRNLRSADLAGRYGGEEFAFVLPRTGVEEGAVLAERIREDIERMVVTVAGYDLRITASIGLAGYPESGATDVGGLVTCADKALYRAKASGKNRIHTAARHHAAMGAA